MKVLLKTYYKNGFRYHLFDTIPQAYKYLLKHYSSFGDWWYYFKTSKRLLSSITDETIMQAIARNVFLNTEIREINNKECKAYGD